MLGTGSFPLSWETSRSKTVFPALKGPPFRVNERTVLAKSMKYAQLLDTSVVVEDEEQKRKHRWKLVRQLHVVTQSADHRMHSLERALFTNAQYIINEDLFVSCIIAEYRFGNDTCMNAQLRWLYASFDRERQNVTDWREVLVYYRALMYFRWVREREKDLVLVLTDIYSEGNGADRAHKDSFELKNVSHVLRVIFRCPCESDGDVAQIDTLLQPLLDRMVKHGNIIIRRLLAKTLDEYLPLLRSWGVMLWQRLSTDLRLTVLDEAQLQHRDNAERIISRFKLEQAMRMCSRNTSKLFFREWKFYTMRSTGVRSYSNKKMRR
jgi:hypothetical protein